jgi:hypothetical protein
MSKWWIGKDVEGNSHDLFWHTILAFTCRGCGKSWKTFSQNLFSIGIVGSEVQLDPLGTVATNRPIVPDPRDYDMEKLVKWWLAGETEVFGENLPGAALSTTNPTHCPDANPGHRGGKPATILLSYGTAFSEDSQCPSQDSDWTTPPTFT